LIKSRNHSGPFELEVSHDTLAEAEHALERSAERWDIWWVIYTTNTVEMLNYTWRKRFKTRGVSPLNQFVILFGRRVPA
jgi:transposase-like protein